MKTILALLVMTALVGVVAGTGLYISARILLPDAGLSVPGWDKFFWSAFWGSVIMVPVHWTLNQLRDGR